MAVDYNDKRLTDVEKAEQNALNESAQTYDKMINNVEQFYQDKIDAVEEAKNEQTQIQQANTDFAIEKIEQQKEQTEKDYIKEQSGAYADWQKQSNKYGVNAEQMAASGLKNSGYSESAQVSMYNTYQNRVATAKASYDQAVTNYTNSINEAKRQNSSILAEIAHNALTQQLELSLQGFNYKNELVLAKAQAQENIRDTYNTRWQDVYDRIKTEEDEAYNGVYLFGNNTSPVNGSILRNGNYITTDYYDDEIPQATVSDAKEFGTFKNGYQPKGINGYGKLEKTGEDIEVETVTRDGQLLTKTQNIWKTKDGTLWYWEGREMKYKPLPKE